MVSWLAARATSYPVVCSAINNQGDTATVTFVQSILSFQITPAGSSKPLSLSVPIREEGILGCSVFFDKENRYAAVGVNHLGLETGPLSIVISDLVNNKLISNFSVQPGAGKGESLKLVGFFRGGPSLLVFGSRAPDHSTKSFSTTLFHVTSEQVNPSEMRMLPENSGSVGNPSLIDASHNRLWFKSNPQFCPLRSMPLVGSETKEAVVDEADAKAACDANSAIAYPDENTIITAVTREPNDLVTLVDLKQNKVIQLVLPNADGRRSYTAVERGVLSPDGQFFAISRNVLSNSFLGDAHSQGMDIQVVQVSPLKVIGKIRLKSDTDPASISIDHRNGTVKVLSFQDGRWKSETIVIQTKQIHVE